MNSPNPHFLWKHPKKWLRSERSLFWTTPKISTFSVSKNGTATMSKLKIRYIAELYELLTKLFYNMSNFYPFPLLNGAPRICDLLIWSLTLSHINVVYPSVYLWAFTKYLNVDPLRSRWLLQYKSLRIYVYRIWQRVHCTKSPVLANYFSNKDPTHSLIIWNTNCMWLMLLRKVWKKHG